MANKITETNIDPLRFVPRTSRYAKSQVLLYGNDNVTTFEIYKRSNVPNSEDDKYTIIPPGEEFRPDKTSLRAYGTIDLWWFVMQSNDISDIFDYKAGLNIRLPDSTNAIWGVEWLIVF